LKALTLRLVDTILRLNPRKSLRTASEKRY